MTESQVLLSVTNHVATITLNRPHKGNALTATMNERLLEILPRLAADPQVRVLVLTGAGKYFCTGMDLSASSGGGGLDPEAIKAGFQKGLQVFDALYRFPKPVIARVNGPAFGGGVGLVFTADIRVAVSDGYFALTEVKRGIIPAIISQYIVPELGVQRTKEYMLTGRKVTVSEATFLSRKVEGLAALDQAVNDYVDSLIDSAPGAMANIKQLVDTVANGAQVDRHEHIQKYVQEAYLGMMQSDEAAFGITAFLSKKKPDWNEFLNEKAKL